MGAVFNFFLNSGFNFTILQLYRNTDDFIHLYLRNRFSQKKLLHLLKICQINYPDRLSISLRSFNSLFWYKIKFEFRVFVEFFILFSVLVNSLYQDGLITLLPDQVVWLEVQLHSFISMSLSLSWSFSILPKFEL